MDTKLATAGTTWGSRVRVSGVMSPALWLCAMTMPTYGAVVLAGRESPVLASLAVCSLGLALAAYV